MNAKNPNKEPPDQTPRVDKSSVIEAIVDQARGNYEDFRYVDRDGLLCVAIPLAERE